MLLYMNMSCGPVEGCHANCKGKFSEKCMSNNSLLWAEFSAKLTFASDLYYVNLKLNSEHFFCWDTSYIEFTTILSYILLLSGQCRQEMKHYELILKPHQLPPVDQYLTPIINSIIFLCVCVCVRVCGGGGGGGGGGLSLPFKAVKLKK